jgi:hypothetical protein
MVHRTCNSNVACIEAIDIINGVLINDGQPSGMVVTTTNLLAKKPNFVDRWRPNAHLKQYRIAYAVQFTDENVSRKLLKATTCQRLEPWRKALADKHLYSDDLNLPDVYGTLFDGGQKKKS